MERFTVEQDGFFGFLHLPERHVEAYSGKALIVLGGSEGNENIPRNLGARFAREGIAALGLCYWNVPGLPDELIEVSSTGTSRRCRMSEVRPARRNPR